MQIFEVYEGKIAIFAVSDEQIDPQAKLIEPIYVKIFAITGEIGHYQEFAAARAVADAFHVGKRPEQVLAVLFGELFGLPAHAAENLDAGDDVVAIEPVVQGIFATAEQNRTVTFFGKDAVEIVYPKCDTAPGKESERDKEAGTNHQGNPMRFVRQIS